MAKDGWHIIQGYQVYVAYGRVQRGIIGAGNAARMAWPYRLCKEGHGWYQDIGVTVAAFAAAVKRGTMKLA